ncbi:MAG: YfiR family protein [Saprospiraceae bacterium]
MVFLFSALIIQAQTLTSSEYKLKAVFIYNFIHFIDWPESTFEDSYDAFIIGIVGGDPFGTYIDEAVAGERIKSHRIIVERFNEAEDIEKCHILFINTHDPDETKRILNVTASRNILTVSDTPNFIRWGGMVRFFTEADRIRLEINNTLARARELKISSKLLRVAIVQ